MQFFFDITLARVCLFLVLLLSVISILRIMIHKGAGSTSGFIARINKLLRRRHKTFGVLLISFGFVHGFLSSVSIITLNLGTLSWVLSILLGASWYFRAKLNNKGWMYYHRMLALLFLSSVSLHVVSVGGFTDNLLEKSSQNPITQSPGYESKASDDQSQIGRSADRPNTNKVYKDGIYTGTASGYRPGLVVQVTIKNKQIADITIVAHNETDPKRYNLAMQRLTEEIVKNQSTTVDGVSRATRTSNGIKNAVNDALTKASE